MKKLLLASILMSGFSFGQMVNFANSSINNRTEYYLPNSPTNTDGNRTVVGWIKGASSFVMMQDTFRLTKYAGTGVRVFGLNTNGSFYPLNKYSLIDTTFLATKTFVSASGFLTGYTETDPLSVHPDDTSAMLSPYLRSQLFTWSNLSDKPSTFSPASHSHIISEVTGLQTSLDSKLTSEVDGSITNEIQTLSYSSGSLSVSGGNSVSIPAQVNSDWNAISGLSQITNKPTLSTVATTGVYADLTSKPSFASVATSGLYSDLTGKPTLSTVATSGSYNDLSNKPTIPAGGNLTGGSNVKITGTWPNITIADSTSEKIYNGSGRVNQSVKIWAANVTPSTSNGYSIDISSAGFSTIMSVNVIAVRNTSSASNSPNVSIKSKTTTSVVVNVVEDNVTTTNVLTNLVGGVTAVVTGTPSVFANTTGLTLEVTVIGY